MLSGRRTVTLLVVLCLGHVLLISAQVPVKSGSTALHGAAFGTMARFQRTITAITDGIGGLWSHYAGLRNASRENDQLRQQVLDLEGQLAAGATLEGSGTNGLVAGGFTDGYLRMTLVSSAVTIAVGEKVLTSGQD